MFGLSDNNFNCIIKTIELNPKVEKAIIFGSRAMGNYKPGSDIDIAVIWKKDHNRRGYKIKQYLK